MNRGLSRQTIFHTIEHRELFLNLLADIHQRFALYPLISKRLGDIPNQEENDEGRK